MPGNVERQYKPNITTIAAAMKKRGIGPDKLFIKARVSPKTVDAILNQPDSRHFLATYKKIADALGIDDVRSLVIEPIEDVAADTEERNNLGAKTEADDDETTIAGELAAVLRRFVTHNRKIYIVAIEQGSLIITFNIDDHAILRIVEAFAAGDLEDVEELIIYPKGFVSPDDLRASRLHIYRSRLERGLPLWHPDDERLDNVRQPDEKSSPDVRQPAEEPFFDVRPPLQRLIESLPLIRIPQDDKIILLRETPKNADSLVAR
jgi:lambda repressor-like predicted transcriptional regulator